MRRAHLILLSLLILATTACGAEEAEEPPPRQRCSQDDLKAYLDGEFTADATHGITLQAADEVNGFIGFHEIRVQIGEATPPGASSPQPVILRIWENNGVGNMIHRLSELTDDGPQTFTIVDASEPRAGSQGRTNLDGYDCRLDESTLCVQIGFDANADQALLDTDAFAFNASGGEMILEIANRRVNADFSFQTGVNLLSFQDDSSGAFEGCIAPRYSISGDDNWPLALTVPSSASIK